MEKTCNIVCKAILLLSFVSFHVGQLQAQDNTTSEKKTAASEANPQRKTSSASELSSDPNGGEKSSFDKQPVIEEVKAQLATMTSKLMIELIAFCKKNSIQGEFVVDLTLEGKGKVLTVFIVSATENDIPKKNLLKNKLTTLQFENIKIPKKEKVKSRYTLTF